MKGVPVMPTVRFTPAMRRHVTCPPVETLGATVRETLDAAFQINPAPRNYVLDDQAELRKHMIIFVDGQLLRDRVRLSDPVTPKSEILIVPSLSGA
jgi:molybdopterin synthase sulfur carrier subunit